MKKVIYNEKDTIYASDIPQNSLIVAKTNAGSIWKLVRIYHDDKNYLMWYWEYLFEFERTNTDPTQHYYSITDAIKAWVRPNTKLFCFENPKLTECENWIKKNI